jgi:UDP-N-acetylmuramoyl-L-alanyl-D-glutamate--2,6-diaminopimelate ligase
MVQTLQSVAGAADWLAARVRPQGAPVLRTDSRSVRAGDAFIAWPGAATDGRQQSRSGPDILGEGAL